MIVYLLTSAVCAAASVVIDGGRWGPCFWLTLAATTVMRVAARLNESKALDDEREAFARGFREGRESVPRATGGKP